MRLTLLPGLLATFLLATASQAVPAASDRVDGVPPRTEIVSSDARGLSFVLEIPEVVAEPVTLQGRRYERISIPGGSLSGSAGEPAVPEVTRLVAVPAGFTVVARAVALEEETRTAVQLAPAPDANPREFALRREAVAPDAGERSAVRVGAPGYLRDVRVVPLTFRPVREDADRREITIARRLRVELEFVEEPASGRIPASQPSVPPSFDALYRELVVNYAGRAAGTPVVPGTYLVICPNDPAVITALQPLLEWRKRSGTPTLLATTAQTGSSTSSIRAYIQTVYDDPTVSLEYVVLVGDASGTVSLPTWYESASGYGGEGDLPYSQLAGSDVLPDVHIGRLSVDSVQTLGRVVSKIVGYESSPTVSDPSWFSRSCLVGDPSSSGLSCIEASRWASLRLAELGFAESDSIFAGPWVSRMQTALNRGDAVFAYRGWLGMSGWSNAYTSILTNGWKMPFAIIITCDTGSFASGTARSESFLRAWDSGLDRPRAAVGAIGMATIGTHTRYNNAVYYGAFRGLAETAAPTMGASLTRGCVELYLNYHMVEPTTVQIWSHWANLMGDPAVPVWIAPPTALTVGHPAALPVGTNQVRVTVANAGGSVEGARVCLWKGDEAWVVGETDATGAAVLPVDLATTGDLLVTVTGPALQPYLATIPVATEQLFVASVATEMDDDMSGDSIGNGDGAVNPGETLEMRVELSNFGLLSAPAVSGVLATSDPYVKITDAQENFGAIAPGATAWSAEDFDFKVEKPCPDGHVIVFELEVMSGLDRWVSRIEVPVVSADLMVQTTSVQDGNARLDPGETVPLSVTLSNDGGAAATAVTAELVSHSSLITVPDPIGSFGTIGIGGTGSNPLDTFTVSAYSDVYEGYLAAFSLITTFSGGVTDTAHFSLIVGDRQSDDPVGPDAHGYLAYDDTDTGYAEAPVYAWVELDPALGGDGTEIVLGDGGGYQDKSVVVNLPFPFEYYGQTFTQATVCSNGWLALGSTPLISYRNWTIPGAGGPSAMLAPFWDNLYEAGDSKVLQKYDTEMHRWILEWSRMRNDYNNSVETFEVILHDPAFQVTETGDGFITYQYATVNNYDPVNGYATVGIESPDQTDGVLYTYFNQYSAGAAPLGAGRAIRFVPTYEGPIAVLEGHVYNASFGDAPAANVDVEVIEAQRVFRSQTDGAYAGTAPPGTYTVVARHASFAPDTASVVGLQEGQVTTLDFHLVDIAPPAITTVQHPWTEDTVGPYPVPVTIEEFSGLPLLEFFVQLGDGSFFPLALTPQGGDDYLAQIPGQPAGTLVRYYVRAQDGIGLEATDPPGAPAQTYSFAVAPSAVVAQDEFELPGGWTVGAPGDDASTGIWVQAEPVGTWYSGFAVQPDVDHTPDPAELCFVTGNATPGAEAGVNDVDNGRTTLLSPVLDLSHTYSASVSYWVWYSNDTGSSPNEDYWDVEVTADGSEWAVLEHTTQSTGGAWVQRSFLLDDYIALTNQVQFRFVASDEGGGSLVEAAVDDFVLTGIVDIFTGIGAPTGLVIRENALDAGRPNPFRGTTLFTYRLAAPGPVRLQVFDVTGRLVNTLVSGHGVPGQHELRWDGRSADGAPVAAGIYFVRMSAGDFREVKRVAVLR